MDLLIFEREYHLWRNGKYLGVATYVDDENIGDAFIRIVVDPKGRILHEVFIADKWKII